MLSRVSEYSYASLLHYQNEYTSLDSINRQHKKQKINNSLVCVVFFLWYFVIQLTKCTKSTSKPYSCLFLKTFWGYSSSPECVIQNNVRRWTSRYISPCNERRTTLFIVLWSRVIFQYTDVYLKFIMPSLLCSWAVSRLLLLRVCCHVKLRRCRWWLKAGRSQWTN